MEADPVMKQRNPYVLPRKSGALELKTLERVEQYEGVRDLLATWEMEPAEVQVREHEYIMGLRARLRAVRNYLLHRADAGIEI